MKFDFEKHLRATQRLTSVGSWEWDLALGTLVWSDELFRIFGLSRGEFMVTMEQILACLHPEDAPRVQAIMTRARADQSPFSCEYRVLQPDGGERIIFAHGLCESTGASAAFRMYGTAQDVTEQKKAGDALRMANERVRVLAGRLLQAQEKERVRIARELHDEIGQSLTAVKIGLHGLKRFSTSGALLAEVEKYALIADRTLDQVRSLSLDLRPPHLDDLGLEAALRWFVREHGNAAARSCTFEADGVPPDLDPQVSITCFRVAQEALTNVVRHANATEVAVTLHRRGDALVLSVEDNGVGFDVKSTQRLTASIGLLGMQERTTLAGGLLEIVSAPRGGTRVVAYVPLGSGTEGA